MEIDDANNTISENDQTIKQLQAQRTSTRNEMQSYSNLIVKTKARLSDLQKR
ncbi:MAG: hypothetical protein ACI4W2_07025 [Eubacterium sp.]